MKQQLKKKKRFFYKQMYYEVLNYITILILLHYVSCSEFLKVIFFAFIPRGHRNNLKVISKIKFKDIM